MNRQTNKIYRIWYKEEWFYDFNAIKQQLNIKDQKLTDELTHHTETFIITPKNFSSDPKEITVISAKQVLKILNIAHDKNIYQMYRSARNGGNIRFNLCKKYEKEEEFFGAVGRTKEDFLDYIGDILSQLSIGATFPVGRQFNVYDTKYEKIIFQPQLKKLPESFNTFRHEA